MFQFILRSSPLFLFTLYYVFGTNSANSASSVGAAQNVPSFDDVNETNDKGNDKAKDHDDTDNADDDDDDDNSPPSIAADEPNPRGGVGAVDENVEQFNQKAVGEVPSDDADGEEPFAAVKVAKSNDNIEPAETNQKVLAAQIVPPSAADEKDTNDSDNDDNNNTNEGDNDGEVDSDGSSPVAAVAGNVGVANET